MRCPCADCNKKGCGVYHSQCPGYLEYRKYRDEINKKQVDANKLRREYESDKTFRYSVKKSVWSKHMVKKGKDHYGLIGEENEKD